MTGRIGESTAARLVWVLLTGFLGARAEDVTIKSFDSAGNLTFSQVPNTTWYRVEQATHANGPWTSFTEESWDWLNYIPATIPIPAGTAMTVSVPMLGQTTFYRVAGTRIGTSVGEYEPIRDDAFYQDQYGLPAAPIRLCYQIVQLGSSPVLSAEQQALMTQKACEWATYMYEDIQQADGTGCGGFVELAYEAAYRQVVLGIPFVPDPVRDAHLSFSMDVPSMMWSDFVMTTQVPPVGARVCYTWDGGASLGHFDLHAQPSYTIGKSGPGKTSIYRWTEPWTRASYVGYQTPLFRYCWKLTVTVRASDGSVFCPFIHWVNPHVQYPNVGLSLGFEQGAAVRLITTALPGWQVIAGQTNELSMSTNRYVSVTVGRIQ